MQLHIDIETYSSIDIKSAGAYRYVEASDFEILMVAYAFDDGPVQIVDLAQGEELPDRFIKALFNHLIEKHAHNAVFERLCFKRIGYDVPIKQWHCSAVKAAYCGYPLSLDKVSKAMKLGDKAKDPKGKALIRYFSTPCKPTRINGGRTRNLPHHAPEKWQAFKDYCVQDVEAEREIENQLSKYTIPETERINYVIDQMINDRGITIDLSFAKNAFDINNTHEAILTNEVKELTGVENPGSLAQLKAWLKGETGKEITSLTKDTISGLIEEFKGTEAAHVLKLRQQLSKTSVKKYVAMQACACDDGRAHGLFQFYGANRTGRWAGRLIQLQNLPQNKIKDLELARETVAENDYEMIELLYGNTPSILSQLIRTAFVAPPGKLFAVADFSAIEARVIAWLAKETWRVDVFNSHGKIYEASASMMFNVPIDKVDSELRSKGKVAELALGYQGSIGAMSAMGAEKMGLSELEMENIVKRWRKKSPHIVKLWDEMQKCAIRAIKTKKPVLGAFNRIIFDCDERAMTIQLPSGRKLFYVQPRLDKNRWGHTAIKYRGTDQTRGTWTWLDTYGGKLTENCLAGDTKVLTLHGWKRLDEVTTKDPVWSGTKWVTHSGLICQGLKKVINVEGVGMTPDHKILTNNGWKEASQVKGHCGHEVKLPDRFRICGLGWEQIPMESKMRLRKGSDNACDRIFEREDKIMRVHERQVNIRKNKNARHEQAPPICNMAINESQMHQPKPQSLSQLWCEGYFSLSRMVRKFRGFCQRHVTFLQRRFGNRPDRQQRELYEKELPLDYSQNKYSKQKDECGDKYAKRSNDNSRSVGTDGDKSNDSLLSGAKQMPYFKNIRQTGCEEQVYDLLNAGELHRFTVLSEQGPIIVHNCVQAIARDLLAVSMERLDAELYDIVMHVHDEVVIETPIETAKQELKNICAIMGEPVSWAEGLPLRADGYITPFYKKD